MLARYSVMITNLAVLFSNNNKQVNMLVGCVQAHQYNTDRVPSISYETT